MSPSRKCQVETTHVVEFAFADGTLAEHPLCVECMDPLYAEYFEKQRQFQFLIDNGVSNKRANEIMIQRLEEERRRDAPASKEVPL